MPALPTIIKFDDVSTWPPTWMERCEIIATNMKFIRTTVHEGAMVRELVELTPQQIFDHHPTGELFQVHGWFLDCVIHLEMKSRIAAGELLSDVNADIKKRLHYPRVYEELQRMGRSHRKYEGPSVRTDLIDGKESS
jgi:hypothetical protein